MSAREREHQQWITSLCALARAAGEASLVHYRDDLAVDRKADFMCVGDKGRRIAQIAQLCARDDERLIGANAIGISCNDLQAFCACHLGIGQVAAVGWAACLCH